MFYALHSARRCGRGSHAGFTLIELLVVVLIIGILAAVALPKYEATVARARFAEVVTWTKTFHDARLRYQMANATMPLTFEVLDVSWSSKCTLNPDKDVLFCPKGRYFTGWEGFTLGENSKNSYLIRSTGKVECRAVAEDKPANQACLSAGFKLTRANQGNCSLSAKCNYYEMR